MLNGAQRDWFHHYSHNKYRIKSLCSQSFPLQLFENDSHKRTWKFGYCKFLLPKVQHRESFYSALLSKQGLCRRARLQCWLTGRSGENVLSVLHICNAANTNERERGTCQVMLLERFSNQMHLSASYYRLVCTSVKSKCCFSSSAAIQMYLSPFAISTKSYSAMNFFFLPCIPASLPSVIIPETISNVLSFSHSYWLADRAEIQKFWGICWGIAR